MIVIDEDIMDYYPLERLKPFDKMHAWIDLLFMCEHEITSDHGHYTTSTYILAKKWKWSDKEVRRFLKELQLLEKIKFEFGRPYYTIYIVNPEKYYITSKIEGEV